MKRRFYSGGTPVGVASPSGDIKNRQDIAPTWLIAEVLSYSIQYPQTDDCLGVRFMGTLELGQKKYTSRE